MPRMDTVTITRPNFEMATYLGSLALKHGVDYMRGRGLTVDDLFSNNAVRSKVLESLSRYDSVCFMGVGHGSSDVFTGHNFERIWWTCDCKELRGRVVYLLSCLTGQRLGPDMVNDKGAWCYIGYKVEFTWIQERLVDPLQDKYGRSFFEPVLEIIYRLADGHTAGEAFKASVDKWNYWIDYWTRSDDPLAPLVIMFLKLDRDGQVIIGDQGARITSWPPDWWWLLQLAGGFAPLGIVIGVVGAEEGRKAELFA
jgi:hypothetical protein